MGSEYYCAIFSNENEVLDEADDWLQRHPDCKEKEDMSITEQFDELCQYIDYLREVAIDPGNVPLGTLDRLRSEGLIARGGDDTVGKWYITDRGRSLIIREKRYAEATRIQDQISAVKEYIRYLRVICHLGGVNLGTLDRLKTDGLVAQREDGAWYVTDEGNRLLLEWNQRESRNA
jgi:predicted transcriptional regulator